MRRVAIAIAVGAALALSATPASAYRPFDGTDAAVAEHGELELEIGPVGYLHEDRKKYFAPAQVINYGIVPRCELVLEGRELLPSRLGTPRVGLVDTGLFLKTVLREGVLQHASGISIASEVGPWLPAVNDAKGVGFSGALIFSERVSYATFHLNLRGARTRAGNADGFAGLIVEGPRSLIVRPVVEVFAERELPRAQTWSALGGVIAELSDGLALDAGVRTASASGAPVFELRGGLTWAIPVSR